MVNLALLEESRTVQEAWQKDAEKHVFDFVNILTYRDKFPITGNSVEAIQMFIEITCLCKLLEHLRESHPVDVAEVKKNWDPIMTFWYSMIYASWKGYGQSNNFLKTCIPWMGSKVPFWQFFKMTGLKWVKVILIFDP